MGNLFRKTLNAGSDNLHTCKLFKLLKIEVYPGNINEFVNITQFVILQHYVTWMNVIGVLVFDILI